MPFHPHIVVYNHYTCVEFFACYTCFDTVLLDLNFTYARVQKATARNIHGNAPE